MASVVPSFKLFASAQASVTLRSSTDDAIELSMFIACEQYGQISTPSIITSLQNGQRNIYFIKSILCWL